MRRSPVAVILLALSTAALAMEPVGLSRVNNHTTPTPHPSPAVREPTTRPPHNRIHHDDATVVVDSTPFRWEKMLGDSTSFTWTGSATSMALYRDPNRLSRISSHVTVNSGDTISHDRSFVVTEQEGQARLARDVTENVLDFGVTMDLSADALEHDGRTEELRLREGDTIGLLSKRNDAQCFFRFNERVKLGPCWARRPEATVLRKPQVGWWWRVSVDGNEGWMRADQLMGAPAGEPSPGPKAP